jgi:hypothetical protein
MIINVLKMRMKKMMKIMMKMMMKMRMKMRIIIVEKSQKKSMLR